MFVFVSDTNPFVAWDWCWRARLGGVGAGMLGKMVGVLGLRARLGGAGTAVAMSYDFPNLSGTLDGQSSNS